MLQKLSQLIQDAQHLQAVNAHLRIAQLIHG